MSLYRQAGRASARTLALVGAGALVVGLLAGFLLGRSTAPEPTLAEQVADVRSSLGPAREGIELAATEYSQAVSGGRVVAPTEYAAARADVQRARDAITAARADLRAVAAERAAALEEAVDSLRGAIARRAAADEVTRLSDAAAAALRDAVGGS